MNAPDRDEIVHLIAKEYAISLNDARSLLADEEAFEKVRA